MAKGREPSVIEAAERRLAGEIDTLLRVDPTNQIATPGASAVSSKGAASGQASHEARVAACARALAPHSQNLRNVLAETARVLVKRAGSSGRGTRGPSDTERELYGASLRALADAGDKRLGTILKAALSGEDAGSLPALSVACFVDDGAISSLLGRAAAVNKTQISFGAEVARMCRGEVSGSRLTSLAPRIKEAHRISLCVELLLPLSQRFALRGATCAPVAEALHVLSTAERHLGRWLIMGEIAHRSGDPRPLDEALQKSVSGPQSSRGAWSFVGWALDPTKGKPSARPTSELIARLSHRPSADRDPGFLFRLGESSVDAALPMLESLAKTRPMDEVSLRASFVLAKFYNDKGGAEGVHTAAEAGGRDELRGCAAAALWDLGEKDKALATANSMAGSESLSGLVWSALVSSASKTQNGRILDGATFRRVHWGWPE